jgi:Recombinase
MVPARLNCHTLDDSKSANMRMIAAPSTGEREIDPAQAEIIRRIFKKYADGMAPRQIAPRLNQEAVPSPRGGQWNASTINGNRQRRNGILNNELYTGRITYNRQRFVKDPEWASASLVAIPSMNG